MRQIEKKGSPLRQQQQQRSPSPPQPVQRSPTRSSVSRRQRPASVAKQPVARETPEQAPAGSRHHDAAAPKPVIPLRMVPESQTATDRLIEFQRRRSQQRALARMQLVSAGGDDGGSATVELSISREPSEESGSWLAGTFQPPPHGHSNGVQQQQQQQQRGHADDGFDGFDHDRSPWDDFESTVRLSTASWEESLASPVSLKDTEDFARPPVRPPPQRQAAHASQQAAASRSGRSPSQERPRQLAGASSESADARRLRGHASAASQSQGSYEHARVARGFRAAQPRPAVSGGPIAAKDYLAARRMHEAAAADSHLGSETSSRTRGTTISPTRLASQSPPTPASRPERLHDAHTVASRMRQQRVVPSTNGEGLRVLRGWGRDRLVGCCRC